MVDGENLGIKARFVAVKRSRIRRSYAFRGTHSIATENSNVAILEFQNGTKNWQIETRAANDGFAFRYLVGGKGRTVNSEATACQFLRLGKSRTRRGEERVLLEAAKRRLLVIFHGCPKPTGEEIRYPNLLTREAVRGLELNFMNEGLLSPAHNTALPFTRLVLGAADYTPLTFPANYRGKTTLIHQVATVLNVGSPLQVFTAFP